MTNFISKFSTILGIFFYMLSLNTLAALETKHSSDKVINIGIYAPFSNESAYIGRNMLGAMELAREQLKSSEIHYEFYTLDKSSQQNNKTLQKFITTHHLNVLLTDNLETGAEVAPLAKKNNIIHFCLASKGFADGKNNFLSQHAYSSQKTNPTVTMKPAFIAQFQKEYLSHPASEAGYTYDIFQLLNNSAVIAMKTHAHFSSKAIASHLLAFETGIGVMGSFNLNKKGILYQKGTLTA